VSQVGGLESAILVFGLLGSISVSCAGESTVAVTYIAFVFFMFHELVPLACFDLVSSDLNYVLFSFHQKYSVLTFHSREWETMWTSSSFSLCFTATPFSCSVPFIPCLQNISLCHCVDSLHSPMICLVQRLLVALLSNICYVHVRLFIQQACSAIKFYFSSSAHRFLLFPFTL
jgi:hypothetical protein